MHVSRLRLAAAALFVLPLVACGEGEEEPPQAPETLLPERPDDKLIEGTRTGGRVEEDPTPQAGTGGLIPNYDPAETGARETEAPPDPLPPADDPSPGASPEGSRP